MSLDPRCIAILEGTHGNPTDVLGCFPTDDGCFFRTYQPHAQSVELLIGNGIHAMSHIEDGMFEIQVPAAKLPEGTTDNRPAPNAYRYRMTAAGDTSLRWETEDPWAFPPMLTDMDKYLIGEGTHFRTYEKMGAHPIVHEGVPGVHFAVWAPNAQRVSVTGIFNRWDGRHHPMIRREDSGIWELFIPHLSEGHLYKYEIRGQGDFLTEKADPYGFAAELRPRTASMVHDPTQYEWSDAEWMAKRPKRDWLNGPMSVYEVHLGSWRRSPDDPDNFLSYGQLADELIPYVEWMGYTHIELLPISEHPLDASWGYQTIGYFAPTSRFGPPDEFKKFIDRCHQAGIGVLIDWVPAHFPKDPHGLAFFDGSHLFEHADPRKGEHRDWGTLIFNYGRNEVRSFLLSNAMFWADLYHIDGFRVDAVASMLYLDYSREDGDWVPNEHGGNENIEAVEFIRQFNTHMHAEYPGILTFAEESTSWPQVSRPVSQGGLGFGLKWNMGWMNDTLEYFEKQAIHRKYHQEHLTFSLLYAFTENFILPFSHDEVVHGKGSMLRKMPGDEWQQLANLRLIYLFQYAHPGKQLLFQGCEFAVWDEWKHDESLAWHLNDHERHHKVQHMVRDLNRLHRDIPALHELDFGWEGFEWIDFRDHDNSIISFLRKDNHGGFLLIVLNMTPVPRESYRVGVPQPGEYGVIFNSDSEYYGGGNLGTSDSVHAEEGHWQARDYSVTLDIPPLGGLICQLT